MATANLSEYEKLRHTNMARNQAMLAQLGLDPPVVKRAKRANAKRSPPAAAPQRDFGMRARRPGLSMVDEDPELNKVLRYPRKHASGAKVRPSHPARA